MEAAKFKSILKKQKLTLIVIPILVMIISFFLVRKLPNVYVGKGTLAAGIVDGSQPMSLDKNILQDSKISQQFSNLIQMMQMKKVFDQVSYKLILHDLASTTPYKKPSKLLGSLNNDAKKHAIEVYTDHYLSREPLSLWDQDQKGLDEVITSMGYGYEALTKKIKIYRIESSDFITIEYESDSPTLSAFVVNTLCDEFIKYYFSLTQENAVNAKNYLDTILEQKKDSLDKSMDALRDFKIKHHVLNLNEQARTLYGQIADMEGRIQQVKKEIDGTEGALASIQKKFNNSGSQYVDTGQIRLNQRIVSLKANINTIYDQYTKSGFDNKYKVKMDSLKQELEGEVNKSTDHGALNPAVARENLMTQKMTLEINRDLAKSSIQSLQNELGNLNRRFNTLVPNEAVIQSYEGNISVASQEYIEILKKFNQTNMAYSSSGKLKQIEMAMPGAPQPSKKMLLVAISGIGSLVFCLLILFILFYIDDSIVVVQELANKTNFPVLGFLPLVTNTSLLNLNQLWEFGNGDDVTRNFKNQLRSVRFETDDVMNGARVLVVTSLGNNEGKTFLAMSLASAYVMVNKRVLLIDGNFDNNSVTQISKPAEYIEDYLTGRSYMPRPEYNNDVTVLGNRGKDTSLFEINNENKVRDKVQSLRDNFDMIIIESSSLNTLNQAKEWISVADKVVAVFESKKTITFAEKQYLAYLKTLGDKFSGWVLNKSNNTFNSANSKKGIFGKNRG